MKNTLMVFIVAFSFVFAMMDVHAREVPINRGSFFSRPSARLLKRREVRQQYEQQQLSQYIRRRQQLDKDQERFFERKNRRLTPKKEEKKQVPVACGVFRRTIARLKEDILTVVPDNIGNTETRENIKKTFTRFLEEHCNAFPSEEVPTQD